MTAQTYVPRALTERLPERDCAPVRPVGCMRELGSARRIALGSADTHCEQHLTLGNGLNRVRHLWLQHERLATAEPMVCRIRLDGQLAPKAVNHHVARGSMLR